MRYRLKGYLKNSANSRSVDIVHAILLPILSLPSHIGKNLCCAVMGSWIDFGVTVRFLCFEV